MATQGLIMQNYDHNESLYMTAGYLVARGHRLYQDFSFWQMPYSAWFYALVFTVTGTSHYLLAGKWVSCLALWMSALLTGAVARRLTGRAAWGLAFAALLLMNFTVVKGAEEASNYILPVLFSVLAFLAATWGLTAAEVRPAPCALAGFASALAVGCKLYYAPTLLPYLVVWSVYPRGLSWRSRLTRGCLPFALGAALGLAPVVGCWAQDPQAFVFNNWTAHQLTTNWWTGVLETSLAQGVNPGLRLRWRDKLLASAQDLSAPGTAALLLALLTASVLAWRSGPSQRPGLGLLAALLVAVSLPTAFLPTPMWWQYLSLPLPFIILGLAVALGQAQANWPRWTRGLLLATLAGNLLGLGPYGQALGAALDPQSWTPTRLHLLARLAAQQTPPQANNRLAVMQGLFAIESGRFEPYLELAYAPFTCAIAEQVPAARRRTLKLAGPADLEELLAAMPPAAVLSGLYVGPSAHWSDLELDRWSQRHGYGRVTSFPLLTLYVPPP